jgi:two-component system, cell cycle response regulator DivK
VMTNQPTILVVEDNSKNMTLARDVLSHDGYAVIEATTAERGLELAREQPPALILLDIQLPDGMDGLEAVKLLKHDQRTAAIPVVAVTAFAMRDDRQRALDAGFDGYLEKPYRVQALREEVRRFVLPKGAQDD